MRNMQLYSILRVTCLIMVVSCSNTVRNQSEVCKTDILNSQKNHFIIHRGINISHWLSQNHYKLNPGSFQFTEQDVVFIKDSGFDHIRIPIDEDNLFNMDGDKILSAFHELHNAIEWCKDKQLKVIIDLHSLRSHSFNSEHNPLWDNIIQKEKFVQIWLSLSSELCTYSTELLAYELLNEPVAEETSSWNELIAMTLIELRKNEPFRTVIIGSNMWQSPLSIPELEFPDNDNNIILSFHFYTPFMLTHYRAAWTKIGIYDGLICYPGQLIDSIDLINTSLSTIDEIEKHNGYYTFENLKQTLNEAIQFAHLHNLPLYCGEFGCLPTVPRKMRLNWYKDVKMIFEEFDIAWTVWDYKGGFAIFNHYDGYPDEILISMLTEK